MLLERMIAGLTGRQLDAVNHTVGPLLILAGAGTGKTTTIMVKIACMVERSGIDPGEILALTFSREAADHMKKKVEQFLGGSSEVQVSTFHSFCAQIIRDNAEKCGVPVDFSILEDVDSAIMLHRDLGVAIREASLYSTTISKAKDLNITIPMMKDYLQNKKQLLLGLERDEDIWERTFIENTTRLNTFHTLPDADKKALDEERKGWVSFNEEYSDYARYRDLINTWIRYEKRKKTRGALDYGDLNSKALEFLNTYGTGHLNERFRYIIIDEFQDTNYVQFELIKMLAGDKKNVTVVADPNQTIYAFRGAYTDNIQEFLKYFRLSSQDVISLDVSFRSTDKILRVSHDLIRRNYSAEDMDMCIQLHSFNDMQGENVTVVEAVDENEEARFIVEKIEECLAKGMKKSDIAVLYRSHAQGRRIKDALVRRGHSIRVKDDTDFLKQPQIKTVLSYMYVLDNIAHPKARGTEAWWRLFHFNHNLDTSDSIRIGEYLKKHRISFQEAIYNYADDLGISAKGRRVVEQMKQRIDLLREKLVLDVSDIVLEIMDISGLSRQFAADDTRHSREALLNLKNLHEMAKKFESAHRRDLGEFIAYLEILDQMGKNPPAARIVEEDAINLMTIHSSKGLEFGTVFVINMAKDRFPLFRGGSEPIIPEELMYHYQDIVQQNFSSRYKRQKAIRDRKREIKLEEERRLCYVAMTRAKEHLLLTFAGMYDGRVLPPSEFLLELGYYNCMDDAEDITLIKDDSISSREIIRDSELERIKAHHKKLVLESMDSGAFLESMGHLLTYCALHEGNRQNYLLYISRNWEDLDPAAYADEILMRTMNNSGLPVPSDLTFSVSAINTYTKCPRMYELKEVLGVPTRDLDKMDGAAAAGNFVHRVLEEAVKKRITTREQLNDIVNSLIQQDSWKWMEPGSIKPLLDVFWERHRHTIPNNLMVETKFTVRLDDHQFKGFIDRVDLIPGSDNEVEIIDYKTGNEPGPEERSRQLLLYAWGFQHLYPQYRVRRLTLELLSKTRPRVYELNGDVYESQKVAPLNNNAIREMIDAAGGIIHDFRYGFERNHSEASCRYCAYRLYCS